MCGVTEFRIMFNKFSNNKSANHVFFSFFISMFRCGLELNKILRFEVEYSLVFFCNG